MKPLRSFIATVAIITLAGTTLHAGEPQTDPDVVELENGFYYVVKKGDTLWDISQKFFDSAWTWPGVWSENGTITNPHRIYPGQKIRLYKRTGTHKREPQVAEVPEGGAEIVSKITPPPPLPEFHYAAMDQVGFITEESIRSMGTVIGGREDKDTLTTGDEIYIKPASDQTLTLGTTFAIYPDPAPVPDPEKRRKRIGYFHEIAAQAEILTLRDGVATAKIHSAYLPVRPGNFITPMPERPTRFDMPQTPEDMAGRILRGAYNQFSMGQGDVIFVDVGNRDGAVRGQTYSLMTTRKLETGHGKKKKVLSEEVPFGKIVLLDCRETASAALITQSEDAGFVGTRIRAVR